MHPLSQQETSHLGKPMLMHSDNQVPFFTYRLFEPYSENITNIVSTRLGGVSEPPYDTLNLSLSSRDNQQAILENRRRLAETLHIELDRLTIAQLIQETHIAAVTQDLLERSTAERLEILQGTDGLLTNIPNAPLAVLVADCTAVSFLDPHKKVIALAHAGWRGTAGNIVSKMVEMMHKTFGCDSADLLVGLSPNMSGDTFQVREDVLNVFRSNFGNAIDRYFRPQADASYHLDLNEILLWQLEKCGVRDDHIEVAGLDTYVRTDLFFSHRAEQGKTGRFCGLIVLRR